jgi:hypothetical protein
LLSHFSFPHRTVDLAAGAARRILSTGPPRIQSPYRLYAPTPPSSVAELQLQLRPTLTLPRDLLGSRHQSPASLVVLAKLCITARE